MLLKDSVLLEVALLIPMTKDAVLLEGDLSGRDSLHVYLAHVCVQFPEEL